MEITTMGYLGDYKVYIGVILEFYRDNGKKKENGSYYSVLGLYRDNGKEMATTKAPLDCP